MTSKQIRAAIAAGTIAIAATLTTACSVTGDGPLLTSDDLAGSTTTDDRGLAGFTKVSAGGTVEVILTEGADFSVTVTTDEALQERVETSVDNGELTIEQRYTFLGSSPDVTVEITVPDLAALNLSGSATATVTGVDADALAIEASGDADAVIEADARSLSIDASGVAKVTARGTADDASVKSSGAAAIVGEDLTAATVDAEVSGAAELSIRVREALTADVSGAGNLRYWGDPKVDSDVSGGGSLHKEDD